MNRRARLLLSSVATVALAAGTLAVTGPPGSAAAPADAQSAAQARLDADASGALTLRSSGGVYDFVGIPAGVSVDNPDVSAATSVTDAAEAHLARYGAALGTARPGTTLQRTSTMETASGDVVRYQQHVGGVPVLGGDFVVSLRADRELSSILARTSQASKVADATVAESAATATAKDAFVKDAGQGGAPSVRSDGRWVLDAGLIGGDPSLGVRTVWRFEVTRAAHERRMILVDDRTGGILMDVDYIQHALNRVVCDNANVPRVQTNFDEAPCVNPATAARVEGGPASAVADVNDAFVLGGEVSDTYAAIGVDLTALIGRDQVSGPKALAQTVRMCYTGAGGCPYANAFWNGQQMYYGTGFASADDVVGHEMTHGVTERTSNLFYWGQSGAMNESISDIMGEIVDHQNVTASDVPATAWALGEDVPGFPTGLRNIQDPTLKGDPDRTGSPNYVFEPCCGYPDGDGVHSNSGVGNKTFYLASQGGTFNSQTITGIDGADTTLTKSAKLWLLVDQTLASGSDYADLGVVLDQSCQALLAAGTHGFTAANCTAVHQAGLATQLAVTPTNNPQPPDAPSTCPAGTTKVELFNSETGTPATKFVANPIWSRNGVPGWGQVAHTAPDAWGGTNLPTAGANSLVSAAGIALPAGQPAYLHFQQWRLLEYGSGTGSNYDAGTVEVDNTGDANLPVDVASLPWVNGPSNVIFSGAGNPAAGRLGFGRDSRGYIASRVDLSSFAGTTIKPQFTMNTDTTTGYIGWWVDDISVYTCQSGPTAPSAPTVTGSTPSAGAVSVAFTPGADGGSPITGYTAECVSTNGGVTGTGTGAASPVTVSGLSAGRDYHCRVKAANAVGESAYSGFGPTVTVPAPPAPLVVVAGSPTIKGKARVGKTLTAVPGSWSPADVTFSYQWLRNGTPIAGATGSKYKLKNKDKGKRISVRVTGSKSGYTPATATSPETKKVKKKKKKNNRLAAVLSGRP